MGAFEGWWFIWVRRLRFGPAPGAPLTFTLGLYMTDPKEINFSAEKTEYEWQVTSDAFFLAATPKLYEWLRWVITLAAISFVQQKSHSTAISVLLGLTYGLTFSYFMAFFYQFKFTGIPVLKTPRTARLVSIILSGLLGIATWYLIRESVNVIVASQP